GGGCGGGTPAAGGAERWRGARATEWGGRSARNGNGPGRSRTIVAGPAGEPTPQTTRPAAARTSQISVYGFSISSSFRVSVSRLARCQVPCAEYAHTMRPAVVNA